MATSRTEPEPSLKPPRSVLGALIWGVACAVCAGSVWLGAAALFHPAIDRSFTELAQKLPSAAHDLVATLALGGLVAGGLVGLPYRDAGLNSVALGGLGALAGALGGGFLIQLAIAWRASLDPLAISAFYWCLIGFCTGVCSHRLSLLRALSERPRHESRLVRAAPICALLVFLLLTSSR